MKHFIYLWKKVIIVLFERHTHRCQPHSKSCQLWIAVCDLAVADVSDIDSYILIVIMLSAMVQTVTSYGPRSIFRMRRYLCVIVVPT